MKKFKLPAQKPKVSIDERGKRILAEVQVNGFLLPEGHPPVKNKFMRNMGYVIDGLLRLADVSVYDEGGTARSATISTGGLLYSYATTNSQGVTVFMQNGIGSTTPTVTDNNLASADILLPTHYIDVVEASDSTTLVFAARWSPDASKSYIEAGLKWLFNVPSNYATLLARTVFSASLVRSAYTMYFDGYAINLPASFTRWFARALAAATCGHDARLTRGMPCTAQDGSAYSLRSPRAFAGTPDVMIGSDNTAPNPNDYDLKAPIASLASQTQGVEVDTTLQEVRVVRTGTYTPSSNVTLGEIGLFANLHGYRAGTLAGRKTLLVRVALSTPVTLYANTTYTLGIVIKLT